MAFTPFFQGTDATNLIQGYLNKNITANTPFEPAFCFCALSCNYS